MPSRTPRRSIACVPARAAAWWPVRRRPRRWPRSTTTEYFRRQQALNREARTRLTKALTDLGYPPVPSQANFVMVDVRRDVRDFGAACRARGVLVGRPFPPLATQARISFGTPDEMTRAIDVFHQVLRS